MIFKLFHFHTNIILVGVPKVCIYVWYAISCEPLGQRKVIGAM
jgi:hypothetical protein